MMLRTHPSSSMFQDPETGRIVLRFGKVDKCTYNVEFSAPFSCLSAFALAVASVDSKVHPNRQL